MKFISSSCIALAFILTISHIHSQESKTVKNFYNLMKDIQRDIILEERERFERLKVSLIHYCICRSQVEYRFVYIFKIYCYTHLILFNV